MAAPREVEVRDYERHVLPRSELTTSDPSKAVRWNEGLNLEARRAVLVGCIRAQGAHRAWAKEVHVVPPGSTVVRGGVSYDVLGVHDPSSTSPTTLMDVWMLPPRETSLPPRSFMGLPESYRSYLEQLRHSVRATRISVILARWPTREGESNARCFLAGSLTSTGAPVVSPGVTEVLRDEVHARAVINYMLDDTLMDYLAVHRDSVTRLLDDAETDKAISRPSKRARFALPDSDSMREAGVLIPCGLVHDEGEVDPVLPECIAGGCDLLSPLMIMEMRGRLERRVVDSMVLRAPPTGFESTSRSETLTLEAMKRGAAVIHRPSLRSKVHRVAASPDFLVRYDLLGEILGGLEMWTEAIQQRTWGMSRARTSFGYPPYVVVQLLYHKVARNTKCKGGVDIKRFHGLSAMEGVMWLNTVALGETQGCRVPPAAGAGFIIGRDPERLVVRVNPTEETRVKSMKSLEWLRSPLLLEGRGAVLLPVPNDLHLYPNMKRAPVGGPLQLLKQRYADVIGELTSVAYITPACRERAGRLLGITSLKHKDIKRLTAECMGVPGGERVCGIVDGLLKGLTKNPKEKQRLRLLHPPPITGEEGDFTKAHLVKLLADTVGVIDYETFYDFENNQSIPFMLGTLTRPRTGKAIRKKASVDSWVFEHVTLESLSEEHREDFARKVRELLGRVVGQLEGAPLLSWGHVEQLYTRQLLGSEGELPNIVDLCKISQDVGLSLPGLKNYRLKEVGRSLVAADLTLVNWDAAAGSPGPSVSAVSCFSHATRHYLSGGHWDAEAIRRYNETDCRMVADIWRLMSEALVEP